MTEKPIGDKRVAPSIMPKGFEYKSNDAFVHDFWVTQLEDGFDKNPKGELIFRGAGLRQFITYQRAIANLIEQDTGKIEELKTLIKRIENLSIWEFIVFKFYRRQRDRKITKP